MSKSKATHREVVRLGIECRNALRALQYAADPATSAEFDPEWLVVLRGNVEAIAEYFETPDEQEEP